MKKIILALLILPFLFQCTPKNKDNDKVIYEGYASLELRLKGKKYDSLTAHARYKLNGGGYSPENIKVIEVNGISDDGYNWTFLVPDSLRKYGVGCYINHEPFDYEKNEAHIISFSSKDLHHRMSMWCIPLEEKETIVEGTYIKSNEHEKIDHPWEYNLPDTIADSPIMQSELFYIEIKEKERYADWELEFRYPYFSFMPEDSLEYEKKMEEYIQLAKKYPNSINLAMRIGPGAGYRSKKDMKRVFNAFNNETHKKYWEEYPFLEEYFSTREKQVDINKLKLINSKTGELEAVVKEKSKPTLVIFSCIGLESHDKVIPFLKDSIGNKSDALEIVFINIDNENIDKWKSLTDKEQIPWRSLLANENELRALSDTYQYWGTNSVICITDGKVKVRYRLDGNHEKLQEIIENTITT